MKKSKIFLLILAITIGLFVTYIFASSDKFKDIALNLQTIIGGTTSIAYSGIPGVWIALLLAFAVGFSMVVTPCFMPVLFTFMPSIKKGGKTEWLGSLLWYSLGLIIIGVILGGLVGLLGKGILTLINNFSSSSLILAIIIFSIIGVIVLIFGLGEFGYLRLPHLGGPKFQLANNLKGYKKSFANGALVGGALGIGCPFPTYHAVLIWAAIIGSPLFGALLLGVLSFGRVLPLLFIGLATYSINPNRVVTWVSEKGKLIHTINAMSLVILGIFLISFWLFVMGLKVFG